MKESNLFTYNLNVGSLIVFLRLGFYSGIELFIFIPETCTCDCLLRWQPCLIPNRPLFSDTAVCLWKSLFMKLWTFNKAKQLMFLPLVVVEEIRFASHVWSILKLSVRFKDGQLDITQHSFSVLLFFCDIMSTLVCTLMGGFLL